jgi:DNA topoisomerase IA
VRVLLLKVSEVYLKVMMTMKKSKKVPAMKVSENFTTIILRQRSDIQDSARYTEASLVKN